MRRTILSAAAPACLLVAMTPVAASADVAPASEATATAARLSDQVAISQTHTRADDTKGDAQAAVIAVGGKPVLGTGGSDSGEGETMGSLIDTVDKSPVRVQVAPWKTRTDGSKTSEKRTSYAEAALARVEVPDQAKIGLLTSDASSEHTATKSTGRSTSNAAEVSAGQGLQLVLLHSEVESNGLGNSYLIGLNGTKIGTREQLGQLCALDISGVAALSCLTATGGTANGITSGAAEVLGVSSGLPLMPASAFATTAMSGTGTTPPSILESVAQAVPAVEAPRAAAVAPTVAPAAELPRTGGDAAALAASGLFGLGLGAFLRRLGRRRSTGA